MKRIVLYLTMLFLIVTMTLGMTGCNSKASQIKDTLSEFEYACRNLDVDAMLDCIDPDVSDPIRLGIALFGTVADMDYEEVVEGLFGNIGRGEFDSSYEAEDFLDTITVSDVKVKAQKDTAVVTCKISFELAGEAFNRDTTIDMVRKNDKWYIADFDMFSNRE